MNGTNKAGYGAIKVPGPYRMRLGAPPSGFMMSHRVAWALANGLDAPASLSIRHRCDGNRRCCNPAHLLPGLHAENMNDEAIKNRASEQLARIRAATEEGP